MLNVSEKVEPADVDLGVFLTLEKKSQITKTKEEHMRENKKLFSIEPSKHAYF